jgi:hypothetical protein
MKVVDLEGVVGIQRVTTSCGGIKSGGDWVHTSLCAIAYVGVFCVKSSGLLFMYSGFPVPLVGSKMKKRKRKYTSKMITEKFEIREVDKKSKIEISQAYGIPLSTLLTYPKNWGSIQ